MTRIPGALVPVVGQDGGWGLELRAVDLLVVGGGITGAGIAAEAAARGLKVLLVERGDFASGASSRSSKLLHGGLRYLEQYHFAMVAQALGERGRLHRRLPPDLATMVPFHYPVGKGQVFDALRTWAGISLYDVMGLAQGMAWADRHRTLWPAEVRTELPLFDPAGPGVVFRYGDVVTDDARLVLAVLRRAASTGAIIRSRAEVRRWLWDGETRVCGAVVEDRATGRLHEVRAGLVLNAAGPWVDALNALESGHVPRLRPTRGAHVLVPDFTGGKALTIKSVPDRYGKRRWMFVIPFQGRSMIGTTDTDPPPGMSPAEYLDDSPVATREEVEYLLASVNAACPGVALGPGDVLGSFAGWRPLLAPAADLHASDVSREHEIFLTRAGVLCMAGGKLTTYRLMARDMVDRAVLELARRGRVPRTLVPGPIWPLSHRAGDRVAASPRLVRRFGDEAEDVRMLGEACGAAGLLEGLDVPEPPEEAEVVWAVLVEGASTPGDVLERRLRVALLESAGGMNAVSRVIELMAAALGKLYGWTAEERRRWMLASGA
ncbi:MAG: glycerol-3-phosphate dehydrogenase/oxidase [Candidatus Sericytochromatia bacterium]|nr:glycerol-3-phosphate dehydrogenase/oxidase [Candidatus Sericytochromatia bacterium]